MELSQQDLEDLSRALFAAGSNLTETISRIQLGVDTIDAVGWDSTVYKKTLDQLKDRRVRYNLLWERIHDEMR